MIKLHGPLLLAVLALTFAGTARAQSNCYLRQPPPVPCGNNQCSVLTYGCAWGNGSCYAIAKYIQCPCDPNSYVGEADNVGCDYAARITHLALSVAIAGGAPLAFVVYVPNCKGGYSIEEIDT